MNCALNFGQYNKSNLVFKQLSDGFGIPPESSLTDTYIITQDLQKGIFPKYIEKIIIKEQRNNDNLPKEPPSINDDGSLG